ncbi:amidase [Methylobacterium durans]|uniref:Amidase n=2 Tax=Methylobacterium durans TaxID=2202825 RepID=A0A2U8W2X9_9HYPH|nr:amidase [Methylobacterium durans]
MRAILRSRFSVAVGLALSLHAYHASAEGDSRLKLQEATVADVQSAMKDGKLTARQLVDFYLARIDAYDKKGPALNAVILVNPKAREIADDLDAKFKASGPVGPLHGVPVLLKDNTNTADMPTTGGSLSLEGYVPPEDATIVKKLKAAGAIIIAKTNLHEFAVWGETISSLGGQTRNPYDLTRTPGGSSGGTGAGLAANFGLVGIGTDTINSIRSPASANSLVGIRPTVGLVSRTGIIPYSFVQDAAGPLARTLTDAVKTLNVLVGYDAGDPATAWNAGHVEKDYTTFLKADGLKGARIGIVETLFGKEPVHQDVNNVTREAIRRMEEAGATMVSIRDPMLDTNKLVTGVSVHLYDLKPDLNSYLSDPKANAPVKSLEEIIASGKFSPNIGDEIRKSQGLDRDSAEYKDRLFIRAKLRDRVMQIMAENQLDALVYPHQQRLVVPIGARQVERNGILGSATGFPAITVPGGFSPPSESAPIGVPVGVELLGRPWDEATLIRLAYSFEQATKFRRPPESTPPIQ